MKKSLFCLCLAGALLAACAEVAVKSPPPEPLTAVDAKYGYRFANLAPGPGNSDELFVVLSFSGGGTRAAALAYGVLEQLRDTQVTTGGGPRRLLDEVDVINGVSGGSYAAAFYGLHRDAFFRSFPERFLFADFQSDLWNRYASVRGLTQFLGWSKNDRGERLAEMLDTRLFDGKTYADLLATKQRPLVVIHATDLSLGSNFQFTQDQLDPLCADLARFPVARAVAASSAVPVLFGPITIRNHAGQCAYRKPSWLGQVPPAPLDHTWAHRLKRHAHEFVSYLDGNEQSGRPWVHLIDGGVSDNLGLRGPLESGLVRGGFAPLLTRLGVSGVRKVVFITVSAEVAPTLEADRIPDSPGTLDMAAKVVDAFMNHNSYETMTWLRTSFRKWGEEAVALSKTGQGPYAGNPEFYLVQVQLQDLEDDTMRERLMTTPTALKLERERVEDLIQAGRTLLVADDDFKRLLQDLRAGKR